MTTHRLPFLAAYFFAPKSQINRLFYLFLRKIIAANGQKQVSEIVDRRSEIL